MHPINQTQRWLRQEWSPIGIEEIKMEIPGQHGYHYLVVMFGLPSFGQRLVDAQSARELWGKIYRWHRVATNG